MRAETHKAFDGFQVTTIETAGFKGLKNGKLLAAASADFDVLVTVDKNLGYQQNIARLPMAVLLLSAYSNRVEDPEPLAEEAVLAVATISKGDFVEIKRK